MTIDELKIFDGKKVRMTKKTGAVYLGTIHRVSDFGGGSFLLVGAMGLIKGTEDVHWCPKGFSNKENRNVWLSKVASIEYA